MALQIIAQLLSERLIPFVALDVRRYVDITLKKLNFNTKKILHLLRRTMLLSLLRVKVYWLNLLDLFSERVSAGRAVDLPVYFGDAGSKEVDIFFAWNFYAFECRVGALPQVLACSTLFVFSFLGTAQSRCRESISCSNRSWYTRCKLSGSLGTK